jgi:hypothetical protein
VAPPSKSSTRAAALRVQHLKQLLSATTFGGSTQPVYAALTEIQLGDLATALDLIASATVIEEKLGSKGADFHKVTLAHCNQRLLEASQAGRPGALANPQVKSLSKKLQFHSQVRILSMPLHMALASII